MICLDSTFIIDFLRNNPDAVEKLEDIEGETLATTEISVYEILTGTYNHEDHRKFEQEKKIIDDLLLRLRVFPLDRRASETAAKIRASLMKKGEPIGDPDNLIAGIILSNSCNTILTRNPEHFRRIIQLKVETY